MAEHNKQAKLRHSSAWVLSVSLHGLLLLGAYWLRISSASTSPVSAYRIELNTHLVKKQEEAAAATAQAMPENTQLEQPTMAQPTEAIRADKYKATPAERTDKANLDALAKGKDKDTQPSTTGRESAQHAIDERALYTISQDKQAGALLELAGWIWDNVPQPQDHTSETGKLIFEIRVDDLGEVMAVKTIEKTVSPWVEQIYREALAKLSFSKTTENATYAPISTGKVTFIIQAK